jgi:hypothetical protein
MTRLAQLQKGTDRAVALVDEPHLRILQGVSSIYGLAQHAISTGCSLCEFIRSCANGEPLSYDDVYHGRSEWRLLPPIDHPSDPARCLVSGTGLTHLGSAKSRQSMHIVKDEDLTDSMIMFRWGVEGGKPSAGHAGTAPEWFYKGNGTILRAHGTPLEIPAYAEDGGEEAEIAGVYVVGEEGWPRRLGMAIGNEFSDHKFEKRNYLNLAGSKIRTCSLGPELVIDPSFSSISGKVSILRDGQEVWTKDIVTGEDEMCHSLANIEAHHFKFETHRRPGDLHVHYYGACALSFGDGFVLADGDVMEMSFAGFGRALRNPVHLTPGPFEPIVVKPLR